MRRIAKRCSSIPGSNGRGTIWEDFKAWPGRLPEGADALREAIRLKPDWGVAYCNLGSVLILQGEIESAADVFQLALRKPLPNIRSFITTMGCCCCCGEI